jgi:hypothetical protein
MINLGRRELGKSTLALFMARRVGRVIIVDPRHLYGLTADPVRDLPGDIQALEDQWTDRQEVIVVQPSDNLPETMATLAEWLRAQLTDPRIKVAVILDEAALLDLAAWGYLFRCAPRDRLVVILTAHRPKDIPTTVRALSDVWCLFRMTQEHDLEVVIERCGPDVARIVQTLRPYEFVAWDDARGREVIYRDPSQWNTDMGRRSTGVVEVEPLNSLIGESEPKKTSLF